jgi:hypothetical protein
MGREKRTWEDPDGVGSPGKDPKPLSPETDKEIFYPDKKPEDEKPNEKK